MRMISETHTPQHPLTIREIIARMRHDAAAGTGQGGAADWHRGREQSAGAAHRAAERIAVVCSRLRCGGGFAI
jgi:hypothetical protein